MISDTPVGDERLLLPGFAWSCLLTGAFFLPFLPLVPRLADLLPGIHLWDLQRVFQGGLLGLGIVWAIFNGMAGKLRFSFASWASWLWIAVASLTLASALTAFYPKAAFLDWAWTHALMVMIILSACLFKQSNKTWEDYWLAPAGIATLLYTFWFFVTNSDYLFSYDFRLIETVYPGFIKSRYFSDFQSVLLFLAPLTVSRYLAGKRAQVLGWCMVGLFYMLAFIAGSRSILAGQIVAHGFLLLVCGKGYMRQFRTYLFCWLLGCVLYFLVIVIFAPWSISLGAPEQGNKEASITNAATLSVPARYDSSGRTELVEKSVRLISSAPWLGVGGRHYGCFLKEDFHDPYNANNGDVAHPHNAILQLAVEWGLPVALIVAAAVVWLLILVAKKIRDARKDAHPLAVALLGGCLALLVHSMVTGVLNAPVSQMLLVILIGWSLSYVHTGQSRPHCQRNAILTCVVLSGLTASMALLLVQELTDLPASYLAYSEYRPTWYLAPRFWHQGWLLPLCGKV